MRTVQFLSKGYKVEANAVAKLAKYAMHLTDASIGFVACQNGVFFPVIKLAPYDTHAAFWLATNGVFVIN